MVNEKKMKVGILTLPLHFNYGGILQAFALQSVLKGMGCDVFLMEKTRKLKNPSIYRLVKRFLKRVLLKRNVIVFAEKKYNQEQPLVCRNTWEFVDREMKIFRVPDDMGKIPQDSFDAVVVGSDQIWRRIYFTSMVDADYCNAFLKFTSKWNCKRIAYAASFGTDEWQSSFEETTQIRTLLKHFDAVSVREKSAKSLCKDVVGIDSAFVLDPTMLLTKEKYENLVEKVKTKSSEGNLLCYFLDETTEKQILMEKISYERQLRPFKVNSFAENPQKQLYERIQPSVEQWLRGFSEAEFVLTDSFHACVFSILFNKPFVVIGNRKRGLSRFLSLLNELELQDHLIFSAKEYDSLNSYEIPKRSYQLLEILRQKSYGFLEEALNAKSN